MNTTGFSLLDLLRRRRELPLVEVARLCAGLPRLLDERARQGQFGLVSLNEVFIEVTEETDESPDLLEVPVTVWPRFTAQISEAGPEDEEEIDRTFAAPQAEQPGDAAPVALARLLYELLGGKQRGPGPKRRLSPLPALNEEGNAVLRQTLAGEVDRESCAAFWPRWLRACEFSVRPAGWHIPRWLLRVAERGTLLRLAPEQKGGIEIALVARPLFRIGRSRSMSDFPARVVDRAGVLDEETTVQVSRVQAVGRCTAEGLGWQDGDGKKPSANGTLWNGEPLPWDTFTPFAVAGELDLSGVFRLSVLPVPSHVGREPEIHNLGDWAIPAVEAAPLLNFSAVVFRPLEGQTATRDAVWLGRGIGFGLGRDRGISWDTAGARSPAQILFAHGCFWLANSSMEKSPLLLNEAALEPGHIAPLAAGQDLAIGGRRYSVSVEG